MTWIEVCREAENILKTEYKNSYKYELYSILKYCLNMDKVDLIMKKTEKVDSKVQKKLFGIVKLRLKHVPLQYILGYWYFMDLKFKVGEGVLVPREDTEVLVNESLKYLKSVKSPKVIDLCSGSGCIAISLKKKLGEEAKIWAAEISDKAFSYLQENTHLNKCDVNAINGDIFRISDDFEDGFFDAVISNPPYIRTGDLCSLQEEVKNEPELALNGGEDGLYFYKNICKMWVPKLKSGGILAFEVGIDQAQEVKSIMENCGINFVKIFRDINNIDRVITGQK